MLHKKTVLVKKRHFYVKKLLFYKLNGYKNTAFLQKYIFGKKQLFYVKSCFFTCYLVVKILAVLQKYIFVKNKKAAFYKLTGCKNTAFLQINRL